MIITEAELRVALGLTPTISDALQARLMLAMAAGHAAVKNHLRYEPEQRTYSGQLYPRSEPNYSAGGEGMWDLDASGRRAVWESDDIGRQYLQLEHLPIREVTEVRVDSTALFGQQSGDFGNSTVQIAGTDYYVEWDQEYICRTGQLIAVGAWPVKPGTVKVSYRAGYSPTEFAGQATETSTNDNGYITVKGVDASAIKQATLLEAMRSYHTLKSMSLNQLTGTHIAGPLSSERLGDYSYSAASGAQLALLTGMQISISPQASMLLEGFIHMGQMLL